MIKKVFSANLLIIYMIVIFQEGLFHGSHILSHVTEIFSEQFSFHQHENGNFHVHHHHGFLETVRSVLNSGDNQKDTHDQQNLPEGQKLFKLHLLEQIFNVEDLFGRSIVLQSSNSAKLKSSILEVLTPPPKNFPLI